MDKGKIIHRGPGKYIVRMIIGGRLYEYETKSKKEARELLEKLKRENHDL